MRHARAGELGAGAARRGGIGKTALLEFVAERATGCRIDRASAQVLAFVARRLLAERVAMVFAVREPIAAARAEPLRTLRS